ncbi:MAG: hypothetical protein IT289_02540 [Oligoflexia bacterium]|nr:hypothetical protein [Oligoflexia bacterium]
MSFRVAEKTYPGSIPRPSVSVMSHEETRLLIATTSWGVTEGSQLTQQIIKDFYGTSMIDPEATSPYAKLPDLSESANSLRAAMLLANGTLFQKLNTPTYQSGVETVALALHQRELVWVQAGLPNLFLLRSGTVIPLHFQHDLSSEMNMKYPLPAKLLGTTAQLDIETKSFVIKEGDKIILLSRSKPARTLLAKSYSESESSKLCQMMLDQIVKENEELPFWIAVIDLD